MANCDCVFFFKSAVPFEHFRASRKIGSFDMKGKQLARQFAEHILERFFWRTCANLRFTSQCWPPPLLDLQLKQVVKVHFEKEKSVHVFSRTEPILKYCEGSDILTQQ